MTEQAANELIPKVSVQIYAWHLFPHLYRIIFYVMFY